MNPLPPGGHHIDADGSGGLISLKQPKDQNHQKDTTP
jgi:hypothetical protein